MADLEKIIKDLSSLSVVEAAELSKKLEEAWGVSAAAPAAVAVAPVEEKAEEQTEFEIVLQEVGSNKISVIKETSQDLDIFRPDSQIPRMMNRSQSPKVRGGLSSHFVLHYS